MRMAKHEYQFEIVSIELPEEDLEGNYSNLSDALKKYSSEGYKLVSTEILRREDKTYNPSVLLIFERNL